MAAKETYLQELVRQLIERQAESRSLDYKAAMRFGPSKADKGELVKCLMAFANSRDGGYILVGVEQAGGKFNPVGVSQDQAASFDPTAIGNFSQNHCSERPEVSVHVVTIDKLDLVLIRVSEFADQPIVCTRDLHGQKDAHVLRAGSVYIRTTDARCAAIESGEDMRALLDLALQKRGDGLLQQIRRLVQSPVEAETTESAPAYKTELQLADQLFEEEDISDSYWYVQAFPEDYDGERVNSNARLREIRREAAVAIRGWDFPHVDRNRDNAFEDGIESITRWGRIHEAHRLYRSGLFSWRRRLAEDFTDDYKNTITYVSSIYSLTEYFLFVNRYISLLASSGDVVITIGVRGLKDRVLREDADVLFAEYTTGAQKFDRTYRVSVEELRASHLDLAIQAGVQLFELFNADIPAESIKSWQVRFLERRF